MTETALLQVIANSGPLGVLVVALFLFAKHWKISIESKTASIESKIDLLLATEQKNTAIIENNAKTLEEHSRRLARLEGHSITQPISLHPEPGT